MLTRMYDGWSASDMGSVYKYYSSADSPLQANRILISMTVITLVSVSAFAFEAWRLDFVPMFSYGVPHAYSYFHIKGVPLFYCILRTGSKPFCGIQSDDSKKRKGTDTV